MLLGGQWESIQTMAQAGWKIGESRAMGLPHRGQAL